MQSFQLLLRYFFYVSTFISYSVSLFILIITSQWNYHVLSFKNNWIHIFSCMCFCSNQIVFLYVLVWEYDLTVHYVHMKLILWSQYWFSWLSLSDFRPILINIFYTYIYIPKMDIHFYMSRSQYTSIFASFFVASFACKTL